ncbi:MAG: carbon storage regulator, partial [Thermoguttaceae bacterium]|nr:carbon storage regulator [Thermoguttaceae bacterium]
MPSDDRNRRGGLWSASGDPGRCRLFRLLIIWGYGPKSSTTILFMEEPMLLLSRKVGEEIMLPTCGVSIIVARLTKNRVSLCITAP